MPTDLLQALQRREHLQRRELWHDSTLVVALSCLGGAFTIVRAFQSEAFAAALSLFEVLE
jgi:hypothetical protein